MFRLSSSNASRRAGVVVSLVASLALVGCMPASASNVRVRHAFFGMHDGTGSSSSYAVVHEGAIRLWDVGTQWQQIETSKGVYNWTRLDQLVTAAQAAHAEVTFVVAMTPHFYSSDPTKLPATKIGAYKTFVTKLMQRYKSFNGSRGIEAYEVWNEANIGTFWKGTPATMAKLTKAMYVVRNKVDKGAKVTGPAMVTRLDYQLKGLSQYFKQRVGGKAVWRYMDAIALSLYPLPKFGKRIGVPEDAIKQLNVVKKRLHRAGVPKSKPIWNTEVNYGLTSGKNAGKPAATISEARQASNVVRTYLLNAAAGVKRVFWYRYDMSNVPGGGGTLGNTLLSVPGSPITPTSIAGVYVRAQQWMHGKLLGRPGHRPCEKDKHGTYKCVVKDSSGKRYVYWNPFTTAKVKLPKGVHDLEGVLGATSTVKPRSTLKVGYKPVMVH
jgi:hypothetical protein